MEFLELEVQKIAGLAVVALLGAGAGLVAEADQMQISYSGTNIIYYG